MTMGAPGSWHLSSLWILGFTLILIEELGLRRLRARTSPSRTSQWRRRGWIYDITIAVVCVVESSPIAGLSMRHLTVHMVVHVVEMFYVPILLIVSAPWIPALFVLPASPRRRMLRSLRFGSARFAWRPLRALVTSPIFAIITFNVCMVVWHIPSVFDWGMRSDVVSTWLMTLSFVLTGYLFWRVILPSGPFQPRGGVRIQVLAIVVTAFEMLVLAISMAIMSHTAWYSTYVLMNGAGEALRDQRVAAGILWICGDFWTIPALIVIVRRLIAEQGGVGPALERSLGRELVS